MIQDLNCRVCVTNIWILNIAKDMNFKTKCFTYVFESEVFFILREFAQILVNFLAFFKSFLFFRLFVSDRIRTKIFIFPFFPIHVRKRLSPFPCHEAILSWYLSCSTGRRVTPISDSLGQFAHHTGIFLICRLVIFIIVIIEFPIYTLLELSMFRILSTHYIIY